MPNFKVLVLIALASLVGFAFGLTLRSPAAPPTPVPTPTIPGYFEIQPGGRVPLPLETPQPGLPVPVTPTLRVRLDIRDKETGQPVRADVVISVAGEPDKLVAQAMSLVEFEVPRLDVVIITVKAPGYLVWTIGIRGKLKYDRTVPLSVPLERVKDFGLTLIQVTGWWSGLMGRQHPTLKRSSPGIEYLGIVSRPTRTNSPGGVFW